jgi:hypothetical protein
MFKVMDALLGVLSKAVLGARIVHSNKNTKVLAANGRRTIGQASIREQRLMGSISRAIDFAANLWTSRKIWIRLTGNVAVLTSIFKVMEITFNSRVDLILEAVVVMRLDDKVVAATSLGRAVGLAVV